MAVKTAAGLLGSSMQMKVECAANLSLITSRCVDPANFAAADHGICAYNVRT
jgi:hypothetical protein